MGGKPGVLMAAVLSVLVLVTGCGRPEGAAADGRLAVVATTGMIADAVRNVGREHVEVTALMGPGVDPHLYKASQGDIARLTGAQVIFYNGLNLEGKIADILEKMGRSKPTVAVTAGIDPGRLLQPPAFAGHSDPHVWFDVELWMQTVDQIRDTLVAADPAHGAEYQAAAAAYRQELGDLHAYARTQLATIPPERRVLVTAHDAFGYFGRAYGVEVRGLQGISTTAEYGLGDVQGLVDVLVQRKIKAVFVESSVPRRSIEAVVQGARARGHEVQIGGELFSDAMGAAGTAEGTYVGMVRYNVDTIVQALR